MGKQYLQGLTCGLVLLGGDLSAQPSEAATYFVAVNGSDSNTCAEAQNVATPKQTPAGATACLASGDTLFLRQGTYTAPLARNIPSGTSWTNATKIASYPGERATLIPQGTSHVFHFYTERTYIILDGLILDGANGANGMTGLKVTDLAHHIRFINGEIKNAAGPGVLTGERGGNEFINCHVHNNGARSLFGKPGFDHGFYIADVTMPGSPGAGNIGRIENCLIENHFHGFAIHIYGGGTYGYVIKNNVIRNTSWSGILLYDAFNTTVINNIIGPNNTHGIEMRDNGHIVVNNTIYGNNPGVFSASGIVVKPEPGGSIPGTEIKDNIIYMNNVGLRLEGGVQNVVMQNNLIANNASGNLIDKSESATNTTTDNLIGNQFDPKFVNPAVGDFRLEAGSAAIDAGVTVSIVTTDRAGTARPQGTAYDIGAYEFVSGGVVLPLTAPSGLSDNSR
jgi:hypothetical protein